MSRTRFGYWERLRYHVPMNFEDRAVVFPCNASWLYGIISLPERSTSRGVLIVVGGPQYRVGSHRQFTLLARHLAAHGVPVLRFDYRGMGDSEGEARTFEDVQDDLRCAIDSFFKETPCLGELVIWGLCDAASAALFYAYQDQRVTGLVLVNPWVRTDQGAAKAYLKHYYLRRFFSRDLWNTVWRGNFKFTAAAHSLAKIAHNAFQGAEKPDTLEPNGPRQFASLPERMLYGLSCFRGKVLLIISGNDLTAREFCDLTRDSSKWRKLLTSTQVSQLELEEANHTFSRREWRDQVAASTMEWVQSW